MRLTENFEEQSTDEISYTQGRCCTLKDSVAFTLEIETLKI
jgi:hypothetical protein